MADDASFHSCCDELQHHPHQYPHKNQHHHAGGGGGGNCCCCNSSDTDDEAQFRTASNSPLAAHLDASISADLSADIDVCAVGGSGGPAEAAAAAAAALEQTLNGDESHRSASPSSCRGEVPFVVASTVSAAEPPPGGRLHMSGCSSSSSSSDGGGGGGGGGTDEAEAAAKDICHACVSQEEEFPPPLASSSRVSLGGLRSSTEAAEAAAAVAAATEAVPQTGDADGTEEATENNSINDGTANAAVFAAHGIATEGIEQPDVIPNLHRPLQHQQQHQYYRDNDLTPHRPTSRRTRSGPIMRQPFSTDNLLGAASQEQFALAKSTIAAAAAAADAPAPSAVADAVDFPSRLRKRVRFADALGLDLTSVVVIAAATGYALRDGIDQLGFEFETFLLDAESDLNRGWLFTESESPTALLTTPSQMPAPAEEATTLEPPLEPDWSPVVPWGPAAPTDALPVALESVRFDGPAVELSARVLNLAPYKSLVARVTFDNWRHQADWSLRYCSESPGATGGGGVAGERFRMRLYLPPDAARLELALRYTAAGREFWDNNAGRNYVYRRRGPSDQV